MNEEVLNQYLVGFDEINQLISTSYTLALSELDNMQDQTAQVVDDLLSMLILAYRAGIDAASVNLAYDLTVDLDTMEDAIYAVIDGKTFEDRVQEHVANRDSQGLSTLAESEYHRVYNNAVYDGGKQYQRETGLDTVRRWVTINDDKVRETHQYLEGMTADLDEEFYTIDGDHARFPGDFKKPENNVNCRCGIENVPAEA